MERTNNYAIAAREARRLFIPYDHEKLARKLGAQLDADYLYSTLFGESYRIHRKTGDISRWQADSWVDASSFEESLTLLDLVCDSREDRCLSGQWRNMQDFGMQFHRNLVENTRDANAEFFEQHPREFADACLALGGQKYPVGDEAYAIEVFDGLRILVQLWFGEEEFPAQLRWLWDANALQYLRYETMYYAVNLLLQKIKQKMVLSA